MDTKDAKKLNKATKHLFNELRLEDFFVFNKAAKNLQIGDNILSDDQTRALVDQAKLILTTELFPVLMRAMKYEASKRMFEESLSYDDMVAGKWMLYTLDVLEKKLKNLSRL